MNKTLKKPYIFARELKAGDYGEIVALPPHTGRIFKVAGQFHTKEPIRLNVLSPNENENGTATFVTPSTIKVRKLTARQAQMKIKQLKLKYPEPIKFDGFSEC